MTKPQSRTADATKRTTQLTEETAAMPVDTESDQTEEQTTDASVEEADEASETAAEGGEPAEPAKRRRIGWSRVFAFGILPALALLLGLTAGFLKWQDNSVRDDELVRTESVQAAKDSTVAMFSYRPDSVEQQLGAARDLLTGEFRDSYTSLINDVVIPGAKQKQITALASVPAAGSVSAEPNQAVVLLFVNQTVNVGADPPTDTASSVRVTLDKVGDRWLISKFDPV